MSEPLLPTRVRWQYFFDRSHYEVAPGGTVGVTVFIQETFHPRNGEPLLAPGTDGLVSGGVFVQASSIGQSGPARVRGAADVTGNPGFDFSVMPRIAGRGSEDGAGILELSDKPVFGQIVSRSAACETVLLPLATFTFTAGKVPGDVTYLTAMVTGDAEHTLDESNVTNSGVVLDGQLESGMASITVSARTNAPGRRVDAALSNLLGELGGNGRHRH